MNRHATLMLIIAGIISVTLPVYAKKKSVLFIGNSYIHTNNMPQILQSLCTASGDTLVKDENTPGGYTLQSHSTDATTANKINNRAWDIVVIQEQSQRPAFPQTQVATQVYPYATNLYNKVKANNTCSEVMFMMTWGYKNGDANNCVVHPPICTYEGMQDALRFSYMKMAQDNNANVAPVGAAWKVVRDSFPSIELYSPDESHPSLSGSYLEACVLYASIFHKSPVGNTYTAGLPAADIANLQRIAAKVVLDSLEQWQQHGSMAYAKFLPSRSGNTYTFQNLSQRATNYHWELGDGNTSIAQDPMHTYAADASYTVILTAENGCNKDMHSTTVNTFPVSVGNIKAEPSAYVYLKNGSNYLKINSLSAFNKMSVYDMNGREVMVQPLAKGEVDIKLLLAPGIYVYQLHGAVTATGKFVQP